MTAKEYLKEFETLGLKVRNLKEAIDRLHELAGPHSPLLTGMPKATPQVTSTMEKATVEAVKLETELEATEARYDEMKSTLVICIALIPDPGMREAVHGKIMDRLSYADLTAKMNYCDQYVRNLCVSGTKVLYGILERSDQLCQKAPASHTKK